MTNTLTEAKNYLNDLGYIIIRIHDEWRILDKHDSRPFSVKQDDQLIDFAKSKGWSGDDSPGSLNFPEDTMEKIFELVINPPEPNEYLIDFLKESNQEKE